MKEGNKRLRNFKNKEGRTHEGRKKIYNKRSQEGKDKKGKSTRHLVVCRPKF